VGLKVGDVVGNKVGDAVGAVVGLEVGGVVGDRVGDAVGATVGLTVGDVVGSNVGEAVGATVGPKVGLEVGDCVGDAVVGWLVGARVGDCVGTFVGAWVGTAVGSRVGLTDGMGVESAVGASVGELDGGSVGIEVGPSVGDMLGDKVGDPVGSSHNPQSTGQFEMTVSMPQNDLPNPLQNFPSGSHCMGADGTSKPAVQFRFNLVRSPLRLERRSGQFPPDLRCWLSCSGKSAAATTHTASRHAHVLKRVGPSPARNFRAYSEVCIILCSIARLLPGPIFLRAYLAPFHRGSCFFYSGLCHCHRPSTAHQGVQQQQRSLLTLRRS
jgi:hypothetical protein